MTFKRDNHKNKKLYYQLFVLIELTLLISLYYFGVHWAILILATPIFLIDTWSNIRCANRQKKYIKEIEITPKGINCLLATDKIDSIPYNKCLFSIREKKFEKDKTEIEIRQKRILKSRLIGRLHISNWNQIFEIKNELIKNNITQIKYRPEGYWSKYGTLTADVVITGTALAVGEIAEITGDFQTASDLRTYGVMPIHEINNDLKPNDE
ncbi:hypothetical protein [Aestuariibaculum suncheonense]|uniref:Uncharacterized protein n=1 Tax=Aestuariibaculum suncheonense TaxID=1028745 RepID=A0A8J6QB86_9FLAO|nr:hypothetical protein [Aestuariibaculum suncheonense]MBD0836959.1 hypothetical protein [Aestuariibaculum suncheonense]